MSPDHLAHDLRAHPRFLYPTALLFLVTLTGCAPHRIDLAPAPIRGGAAHPMGTVDAAPPAPEPWWATWDNAELDALVRRALAENLDVSAARARVAQALSVRRRAGAALGPLLELELGLDHELHASGRARRGAQQSAGLGADWEVDVFGRLGGVRIARGAEAWARWNEAEDFRLRLSADTAEVYLGIVEQRLLLALLDDQMGTARELLKIIEQRYREGLISRLDVLQQETQVTELEAQIPVARAALEDLQSLLSALLGAAPGDFSLMRSGESANLPEPAPLARLDRADQLLLLRPDLRAAQAALVAADGEIARALAERLPRLTLSGDALRVAADGPNVTSVSLGAELVQPLLDWGSRRAEWRRAKDARLERLASFSQAYLRSVWQVESLAKNEQRQRELLESLARRRALLNATIQQARNRYDSGLTDYLPVLSATQQFYSVEQRLVRERRRLASLRVALHRALGGPLPPDPANAPPASLARAPQNVST